MNEMFRKILMMPPTAYAKEVNEDTFTVSINENGIRYFQVARTGCNAYHCEVITQGGKIYSRDNVETAETLGVLADVWYLHEIPEGFEYYMEVETDD